MVLISVAIVVLLILVAVYFGRERKVPTKVILLTVDSFNASHISSYGYQRDTMPNFDRLASEGVIFKNVFGSAAWTSPGLISIFTGLHPAVHGVDARGRSLSPATVTIFDIFRAHGYAVPNITYLTNISNFAELGIDQERARQTGKNAEKGFEVLKWLEKNSKDRFFLWYHYSFLHLPYNPQERFNVFLGKDFARRKKSKVIERVGHDVVIPKNSITFTKEEEATAKALYDGQLRELDDLIGKLWALIEKKGWLKNTLLIITADHGEELFEHGFIGHASTSHKATLYDEILRIPLLLYAPDYLKGGGRITNSARQVDIMPTILTLMGWPVPDLIHGTSLLGRIENENQPQLSAFSESIPAGYQSTKGQEKIRLRALRKEKMKIICQSDDERDSCQLFNLALDHKETIDLFDRNSEKSIQMKTSLNDFVAKLNFERLARLAKEKEHSKKLPLPVGVSPEIPVITSSVKSSILPLDDQCKRLTLSWSGNQSYSYLIQYDVGRGFRNLKGYLTVDGNTKNFGPLPKNICESLPSWNPFKIRITPYGLNDFWSDWSVFTLRVKER